MICPKCTKPLAATVIPTRWDGEFNILVCVCGYSVPIPQSKPFDIMHFRSRVSQLMEAA